jgi:serine/threonine protein kinase
MELSPRVIGNLQSLLTQGGSRAERYTLFETVGRGAMGTVYRAHDAVLGRDVAFKVLEGREHSSAARERFERESLILAGLEHPGIVPVHDAGELADGRRFHVMQLVRGQRLDGYAQNGLTRGEALRLMLRLAETVAFANSRGVVHRDLKPGNIMVGPFGEVLVLDWGVAKVMREEQSSHGEYDDSQASLLAATAGAETHDGIVIGTPGYMAPEQQSGESNAVDQRADVYALGVILRELLGASSEGTPRSLRAIVERATQPVPDSRYTSALELSADIRRWLDGEAVHAHRESALERAGRFYRQHQVAILLVLTYLVVRVSILLWRNI